MKSKIDRMLEALNESKDKDDEWAEDNPDYFEQDYGDWDV